jgi:type IV secretory pathway TrbL component
VGPLKWWGGVLAFFGLVALVSLVIDMRAAGSKVESSVAARRPSEPAVPGGRRERREAATATNGIPVVAAPAEDWTGEVPVVPSPQVDDAAAHAARAAREQGEGQGNDDKEDRA